MSIEDMITEEHRNFAATRMVNLLADSDVFSDEVKQAIRLEGMKFLTEPRNFALSTTEVVQPVPNPAMVGFNAGREARKWVSEEKSQPIGRVSNKDFV